MDVDTRHATPADVAVLQDLDEIACTDPGRVAFIRDAVAGGGCLVAERGGRGRSAGAGLSRMHAPGDVSDYATTTARLVPGLADVRRMAALLLAERVPDDGRVLVVGAGGGAELELFARLHPGWRFDGVDPAEDMLRLAVATLGPLGERVTFHHGYVDAAPTGPFDAASCLLTLHFTTASERRRTLQAIHRRLRPGAALVVAHLSFPQGEEDRDLWLSRYAAFATSSGVDAVKAIAGAAAIRERLEILSPQRDEDLLREAGFSDVATYYVGLCFRGWVAYA